MTGGVRVIVFAKALIPGQVKTRLAAGIGTDAATRVYRALVADTIGSIFSAPGLAGTLACAPAPDAFLSDLAARRGLDLDSQRGAGLFERLCDATHAARARGAGCVLFIGSDTPTLPRPFVDRAAARVAAGADVVFGPSHDGGYTLVALGPRVDPEVLFRDVPWDTDRALSATRANAAHAGWRVGFVPTWYDIDDPADLEYLRGHLASLDPASPDGAPETRRVLADLPRRPN